MIEIGASTANFYPDLTENALNTLLDLGFHTLEVFINTESELDPRYIQRMREQTDAAGARILSLHPYISGNEPFLLYSAYKRRFEDGKKLYARFFETAAAWAHSTSSCTATGWKAYSRRRKPSIGSSSCMILAGSMV